MEVQFNIDSLFVKDDVLCVQLLDDVCCGDSGLDGLTDFQLAEADLFDTQ